jgi:hypothetical protein
MPAFCLTYVRIGKIPFGKFPFLNPFWAGGSDEGVAFGTGVVGDVLGSGVLVGGVGSRRVENRGLT